MVALTSKNSPDSGVEPFKAPDGGWGWVVVFASFLIHFLMDGMTYSLGTYLNYLTTTYDTSNAAASVVHSLLPAVTLACGPIASIFTNLYGCRMTTIIGGLIASGGFMISYFATSIFFLYISIGIVVGIGFGLIYVPAMVAVGFYFERKRSLAIGIAVCGSGIGTFFFSPINRILIEKFGMSGDFLIKGAILLLACFCGGLFRPVSIEPAVVRRALAKQDKDEQKRLKSGASVTIQVNDKDEKLHEAKHLLEGEEPTRKDLEIAGSSQHLSMAKNEAQECAKSMPHLLPNKSTRSIDSKKSPYLVNAYSSMDIMAHVRSLQKIPASIGNLNEISPSKSMSAAEDVPTGCASYIDMNIFKDPIFIFFAISNFLTSLGFNAPYIYIVDQARTLGISENQADLLLSTIGISNMVGRIVLGVISDVKGFNNLFARLMIYATVLTLCGASTVIEPFFGTLVPLFIYCIIFGFTSGGYVSLTSVLIVDLFGLDKLTNAFGILLVFQGVATAIGPPFVGFLYDQTKSYFLPFVFTGVMIGISGAMCFIIPKLKKCLSSSSK